MRELNVSADHAFFSDGTSAMIFHSFSSRAGGGVNPISSSGWSLGFRGLPGFELKGAVAEMQGLGFRVQGLGFRV